MSVRFLHKVYSVHQDFVHLTAEQKTLVVHWSRYLCAVRTQNHVFVREKSSSV
jgi:hypothetical protein